MFLEEPLVKGRYINFEMIYPFLQKIEDFKIDQIFSNLNYPISLYKLGNGQKKVLIWSQMHGNESTTTKAILNFISSYKENDYKNLSLYIIPMLNPDGAKLYTRNNYNDVDLNRDAKDLSQKESIFLRSVLEKIKPDFCFNLHDQRSIFGLGDKPYPATISFLAPSQDEQRSVTVTRKTEMNIILQMYKKLNNIIPNQIGRFDDSFNINCTGDMFTSLGYPTILFEAGHYKNDYNRDISFNFVLFSIKNALEYINDTTDFSQNYQNYFIIPENYKPFCDIVVLDDLNFKNNYYIMYQEKLINNKIEFIPSITFTGIHNLHGHQTINLSSFYNCKKENQNTEDVVLAYFKTNLQF